MEFYRDQTDDIRQYIKNLGNLRIFLLTGEIGAGKTTFIRNFLENPQVTSPTFSFCHQYEDIFHFDLYRLTCTKQNLANIGFFDALFYEKLIFIEWTENLPTDILQQIIQQFRKDICKIYFAEKKIFISQPN